MKAESGKHCKIEASLKEALGYFIVKGYCVSLEGNQYKRHQVSRI